MIHDNKNYVALSEGLDKTLAAIGRIPNELCTDRLSVSSRNRDGR